MERETHFGPPAPVPQLRAAAASYVAAGAPSLVVAPVAAHDGFDQATVQFLLQRTFLERAAEVKELGEIVANQGQRLVDEANKFKGRTEDVPVLSDLERLAIYFVVHFFQLKQRKEEKIRKRKIGGGGGGRGRR